MKKIEVSQETYTRFQSLAEPLIDTPETLLVRLLDHYEKTVPMDASPHPETNRPIVPYGDEIPPLKHAKLLYARFGNKTLDTKMRWNSFLALALSEVMARCNSISDLHRISTVNVCPNRKEDEGYKYLKEHNFSYQGVDASNAAESVKRCARHLGREAYFEFEWRNKRGAFKPGRRGSVAIQGSST